jgi:hypothetical protein
VPGRADRAAEPVEKSAVRLVIHRVAPAARRVIGHVLGEDARDGRGVVVGGDLGIAGHGREGVEEENGAPAQLSSWILRSRASSVQRARSARM